MQRSLMTLVMLALVAPALGCSGGARTNRPTQAYDKLPLEALIAIAVSDDRPRAEQAVRELRARGPTGFAAICARYCQGLIDKPRVAGERESPVRRRIRWAVDHVAGQKDAHRARLFWYTDFGRARAAAQRRGKPILSLRLLGRLDSDMSCANSRFFRTVLYADRRVADVLARDFVLHWRSVRPVPVITIDFGDGRKMRRPFTGNSIHYVLDGRGELVDGIPGLYGAEPFLRVLRRAAAAAKRLGELTGEARAQALARFHADRLRATLIAWRADLARLGVKQPTTRIQVRGVDPTLPGTSVFARHEWQRLHEETTRRRWEQLSWRQARKVGLGAGSRALMREKFPLAPRAAPITVVKSRVEDPLLRAAVGLEDLLSLDTVKNEYERHAKLHLWLARGAAMKGLAAFNDRVYAELFLTPREDPWLGLVPMSVYSALDRGGLHSKRPPREEYREEMRRAAEAFRLRLGLRKVR